MRVLNKWLGVDVYWLGEKPFKVYVVFAVKNM